MIDANRGHGCSTGDETILLLEGIREQFRYNRWATEKILVGAEDPTREEC
jgi:hypothetical protein